MSVLSYNPKTDEYFYRVTSEEDAHRAENVGLTLSTTARGPDGEPIYFTNHAYAALPFFREADKRAKPTLERMYSDYTRSWAVTSDKQWPAPAGRVYMPFQRAGIEFGVEKGNVLIADEPGLGKTVQAIGISNAKEAESNLVVCPAALRLHWQRMIRQWSIIPEVNTYPIFKATNGVSPDANWVIVSYDLARNEYLHEALYQRRWNQMVLDEAHFLKEHTAKRTQALFGGARKGPFSERFLAERVESTVALTGTPLPNRPRECYTIARALNWEAIDFMSLDDFRYRFNPSGMLENGHTLEKKGRLPELQARLRSNLMIRRLKSEVVKDLPDKTYELTYLEANGAVQDVLRKEALIKFTIKDLLDPFAEIWGQISTVRREMAEAMIPQIVEHIKMLLDIVEIPKIVVFSHHHSVMNALKTLLEPYGVVESRGGMSANAKQRSVDLFISDPRYRIFSGQLDAAGFGIDGLQGVCQHVVLAEPAWTPGTNEQAIDRVHRIGQHENVVAQFLLVEGSLCERVLAVVLDKAHGNYESLDRRL